MKIQTIHIEEAQYGPLKGKFTAKAVVKGGTLYSANVEIDIPDELLNPIVDILMQAISLSMQKSAEEFAATVAASLLQPVEHAAISDGSEAKGAEA